MNVWKNITDLGQKMRVFLQRRDSCKTLNVKVQNCIKTSILKAHNTTTVSVHNRLVWKACSLQYGESLQENSLIAREM